MTLKAGTQHRVCSNPRSRSFIDICPRSLRFNSLKFLFLKKNKKNTRPFEAKFHMEPPWEVGMKIYLNVPGHMTKMASSPIYEKTSKISFFGTKRLMILKLGIQHRVLKYYQICSNDVTGWLSPFLWHGQICFLMLLHGWKLIQHIVVYFQACSAYPMHLGERYRTNGPLDSYGIRIDNNFRFAI